MKHLNFLDIVRQAWLNYDNSRAVESISDISARVSTNHVYALRLDNDDLVIAKLSYFGTFKHFKEDHTLINALANNLPQPFDRFLARSLMKGNELYTYRYQDSILDAWVVFYNPIEVKERPPKVLSEEQIKKLGQQVAQFHKVCYKVKNVLPEWSKTLRYDIEHLLTLVDSEFGKFEHRLHGDEIKREAETFLRSLDVLDTSSFHSIPVFVDWNIGNFSVDENFNFYSRWDYDWFRMSSRVMDFYFFSRVCSSVGDRTYFSYLIDPLMEDRFLIFLKAYHEVYPLTRNEILFIKEAYRFFILNYVIKDGRYFFHEVYASRLRKEAFEIYFPQLESRFDPEKILQALSL